MSGGKRRVAITHRYFWPQRYPYADMLRDLTESVAARLDDVIVLTTAPVGAAESRELTEWAESRGIEVRTVAVADVRTAGRLRKVITHVRYSAWLFWNLLRTRPDMTWVASTPPVIAGVAVRMACKVTGGSYVYHIQDIHPEAIEGSLRGPVAGALFRAARALDRVTVERAQSTVVLSQDMLSTILRRDPDPDTTNLQVINNFLALPAAVPRLSPITTDRPFRMLFAGRVGPFQQLEQVLDVALEIDPHEGILFEILGDGPSRRTLQEFYGHLPHVRFLGHVPRQQAHQAMGEASCGIVSLRSGTTRVAYPSKVLDYRAFGLPIMAMVDSDSELARSLVDSGSGCVPTGTSPKAIADEVRAFRKHLLDNPPDRDAMAARSRAEVSADVVVPRLTALVANPVGAA